MAEKMEFSAAELDALRKEYAAGATDEQFTLWIEMCKRRRLTPVQDVVLQVRNAKEYDPELREKVYKKKAIYITTIAALRKIAQRTGQYGGALPSEWVYLDDAGRPAIKSDVPLPEQNSDKPATPWACRVAIIRKDFTAPVTAVARFDAYAQTYNKDGASHLNSTWSTRGPEQLEKCAKALALREAFPEETAGLYLDEEIPHVPQDVAPAATTEPAPVAPPPAPVQAPVVNHTPAEPKVEPRPGEKKSRKRSDAVQQEGAAQPAAPAQESAPPAADPMPTSEEKKVFANKIRSYKVGRPELQAYIVKLNAVDDWSLLTRQQWEATLARLDEAQTAGDATLQALVAGTQGATAA